MSKVKSYTNSSIIVENITTVNQKLQEGRYFYADMKRDAVTLYDSGNQHLATEKDLSPEEILAIKTGYYTSRIHMSHEFLKAYRRSYEREEYKFASFQLHQSAEGYLTTYLLVKTGYKPKDHDLMVLWDMCSNLNPVFKKRFDLHDESEETHFKLLRKAYTGARYDDTFQVTKEELDYLTPKVERLQETVVQLCEEEIQ